MIGWRWVVAACALSLALIAGVTPARAADPVTFADSQVASEFLKTIEFRTTITSTSADITDVRLYYGHIQDAVRTQALPTFTKGRQVAATFTLNTRERYLPPGSQIEYFWAAKDASGVRFESPRQQFTYLDQRHTWRSRTLGVVTLHWYAGNDAFAQDVLETGQRTIDRMKQQVGVEPTEPINIYFYGSNADFAAALPPNSAEWIGGQAYPGLNLIIAGVRPDGGAAREVRRMVPHELSHIVLHQATNNPYNTPPTWLDEGLAVYNQETPDSRFPRMISDAARANRLIPLRGLNSSFPLDPNEAVLSYAQSAAVVQFVLTQYGPAKSGALVAIFREGVSYDEAVQRALGVTIEELDQQWRASLGQGSAQVGVGAWAETTDDGPWTAVGSWLDEAALPLLGLGAVAVVLLVTRWQQRKERWL
jgi:hypothetical protein